MAIDLKVSFSQSPDGKTLNIIDDSVGDKTGYSRSVQLYTGKDGTGTLITTLNFTSGVDVVSYEITKDQYFSAKLIYIGSPSKIPVFANFTTVNFELQKLYEKTNKGCGCVSKNCDSTFYGFITMYLSQTATLAGNSGLANSLINSSAKWLQ